MRRKNSLCFTEDNKERDPDLTETIWLGAWVPDSAATTWMGAWVSGAAAPEKVPAFFDFAGTFLRAIPIETHGGSFYRVI